MSKTAIGINPVAVFMPNDLSSEKIFTTDVRDILVAPSELHRKELKIQCFFFHKRWEGRRP